MLNIENISVEDFNYELPNEKVAQFPLVRRNKSKLLLYKDNKISEDTFSNIAEHLNSDDLLVLNNTKVIKTRMMFKKETGSEIEIFCIQPLQPSTFEEALSCVRYCTWDCIVGNLRKWKDDSLNMDFDWKGEKHTLTARKTESHCMGVSVRFEWSGDATFNQVINICGEVPIPPYLKRSAEAIDEERYQTVYSKFDGSVAAPTAGLHIDDGVLLALKAKRITVEEITLHVGAGTFMPMKADFAGDHIMHSEYFKLDIYELKKLLNKAGKIVAVGTTSLRALESMYWLGVLAKQGKSWKNLSQWEAYENPGDISARDALEALISGLEKEGNEYCYVSTSIMVVPGYKFKMIKGLITNFHQPKSTLLMLIAALVGDKWKDIYKYAKENDFRFLSYGDSSLLLP